MPKQAKNKSIAIDLDDVLADHVKEFIRFSNERYGTNLTVEDYSDHWADLWFVKRDEIERRAREFHVSETILSYETIGLADKILNELKQQYDLYIVTARPEFLIQPTLEWVNKHFKDIFQDVHFVPYWLTDKKRVTKAEICRQIGADYLIDDLPAHCNTAAEAGIQAFLFGDYAWNRHEQLHKDVIKVSDWEAVKEYFLNGSK